MKFCKFRRFPEQHPSNFRELSVAESMCLPENPFSRYAGNRRCTPRKVNLGMDWFADTDQRRYHLSAGFLGAALQSAKPARRKDDVVVNEHDILRFDFQ